MPSTNETLQDREIRHHVGLQRLAAGQVREILELLQRTEDDLRAILSRRLAGSTTGREFSPAETARIEGLMEEIGAMRRAAYREAGARLETNLQEIGQYEIDFQERLLGEVVPAPIELSLATGPALEQVAGIVRSKPFQGLILRDWVADLAEKELSAMKRQIQIGMVEGQGIEAIVDRVVGSRSGHIAGVLKQSRRHATTWVRSAVSHTANEGRDALLAANTDVIKAMQWNGTLDTRTTSLCIARDGHTYSVVDKEPLSGGPPWLAGPGRLHAQCRSGSTPVLRSWQELGFNRDELPEGARASMNGQVPGKLTYREWIQRQPVGVQNDVLGVRRARLLRAGDVSVADLFDDRGRFWTLQELREREGLGG